MTLGRLVRTLALAALAGVLALAGGFAGFVVAAQRPGAPPPHADAIVALTGGAERVETALRLLTDGRAGLLLVSGVAHSAALADLAHRAGLDPVALAPKVTLGRTATSTVGNAEETAAWAAAHGISSLIVVTAGYHMPRALLEFGRSLPGVALHPAPVQPPGLHEPGSLRLLASEYLRLLGAACGLSRRLYVHPPS